MRLRRQDSEHPIACTQLILVIDGVAPPLLDAIASERVNDFETAGQRI